MFRQLTVLLRSQFVFIIIFSLEEKPQGVYDLYHLTFTGEKERKKTREEE